MIATNAVADALLLDEMFSAAIARLLVARGIDCDAVVSRPLPRSLYDDHVIQAAIEEGRVIVTNNVVDFELLRRQRAVDGQSNPAFIYTSDERFPRNRAFIHRIVDALEGVARRRLVSAYGGVLWLTPLER